MGQYAAVQREHNPANFRSGLIANTKRKTSVAMEWLVLVGKGKIVLILMLN